MTRMTIQRIGQCQHGLEVGRTDSQQQPGHHPIGHVLAGHIVAGPQTRTAQQASRQVAGPQGGQITAPDWTSSVTP